MRRHVMLTASDGLRWGVCPTCMPTAEHAAGAIADVLCSRHRLRNTASRFPDADAYVVAPALRDRSGHGRAP